MSLNNPENERIKRKYFAYLKAAKGLSEPSIDCAAKAISRFEKDNGCRTFKKFHVEQAIAFRRHLAATNGSASGKPLSHATALQTLNALGHSFSGWPISRATDPAFLTQTLTISGSGRIAKSSRERPVPTLEQIERVLATMPHSADLELRDRAIVALTLLTGVRDGALVSLKLKHLNITEGLLVQDAREVNTKFAKSFTTWFFPVGCNAMGIIEHWVSHLQKAKLWGVGDPLFPATAVINGEARKFEAAGLSRRHWSSAAPVRMIFRNAFASVELPYFNPHSFRKTLARLGERICRTPEQLKAWSQNLGHDDVLTTLKSYGSVASDRQAEIIRDLAIGSDADFNPRAALKGLEDFIRQKEGIIALDSNLWVHQRVAHGMICYAIGQLKIF